MRTSATWALWILFTLQVVASSSGTLSPDGANVCNKPQEYKTLVKVSYTGSTGWWLGKHDVTRYKQKLQTRYRPMYKCCDGWTQSSPQATDCTLPICYDKTSQTGACNDRGSCTSPDTCSCHTGYTGSHCDKCDDAGGDPEHSLYWKATAHPDCELTCSWKNLWCWPGDCPDRRLRSSCTCRDGFVKVDQGAALTKCDLTKKPEMVTCHIKMMDAHGNTNTSTSGAKSTACTEETDTYVNLKPKSLSFNIQAIFKSPNISNPPNYIKHQAFGIVQGKTTIIKQDISGNEMTLREVPLQGGSSCNLSFTSPSAGVTCTESFPITTDDGERAHACSYQQQYQTFVKVSYTSSTGLWWNQRHVTRYKHELKTRTRTVCRCCVGRTKPSPQTDCARHEKACADVKDGERICVKFTITSGGFFEYTDFGGNVTKGTEIFRRNDATKQLCFRYDFSKPTHCSKSSLCTSNPLELSSRITREGNIRIQSTGWSDPVPHGGHSDTASGLAYTKLYINKMVTKGAYLYNDHKDVKPPVRLDGMFNIDMNITLPDSSGLYAVLLEIVDKAGNRQTIRRFVLYDKSSVIKSDPQKQLWISSAALATNFKWQTNHGQICGNWTGTYYNDQFRYNNPLKPIESQPEVQSGYDQISGPLPVTGTTNVDGLIDFMYSISMDRGSVSTWKHIPDFTKQSVCLSPRLHDGQEISLHLKMKDIMKNSMTDSVTVYIDSTVPDISHMWLVKDGHKQVYVHDSTDISTMVLQFDVKDPHSGVKVVEWYLGTQDHSQDLGHGNVLIQRLDGTSCPINTPCYCPSIGKCQFSNHTIDLNLLKSNGTSTGQHNQPFYFTVVATNEAGLRSIDHLDILVDTSPPEDGSVREGSMDGSDVDYTSEDTVLVNWDGFIDHESGINHYLVALSRSCLDLAEMENSTFSGAVSLPYGSHEYKFDTAKPGKYFASVIAFNEALSPSDVVCSDGIMKDDSPPLLYNVSLSNAKISEHVVCHENSAWLVRENLTMIRLDSTGACQQVCGHTGAVPLSGLLPMDPISKNDTEWTDNTCQLLPRLDADTIIYLPSDKMFLTWNSTELDSQMRDFYVGFGSDLSSRNDPDLLAYKSTKGHHFFKVNHAGVAGKTVFFIFIKAVNKAGLTTTVGFGPVMIDNTPPIVNELLIPETIGPYVYVQWKNTTFDDPEERSRDFMVLYRISQNSKHVTPILQSPQSASMKCKSKGFAGCIRFPLERLQHMDTELNQPFTFELYVYNSAGHFSIVSTKSIQVPSKFPPGHGLVMDVDPGSSTSGTDVDFHASLDKACVFWTGFLHHTHVSFEVALGTAPNKSDVSKFTPATSQNSTCVTSSNLKPHIKYYATIKARCPGGYSFASSDGFVIIDPLHYSMNDLLIYDGHGCESISESNRLVPQILSETRLTYTANKRLHIGQQYTLKSQVKIREIISKDMHLSTLTSNIIECVPYVYHPVFDISFDEQNNHSNQVTLQMCTEDLDFQVSDSSIWFHWVFNGSLKENITHYEVVLQQQELCQGKTDNCFITMVTKKVKTPFVEFTSVNLHEQKLYRARVRPCFGTFCFAGATSDGVTIVSDQVSLKISSHLERDNGNQACEQMEIKLERIDCGGYHTERETAILQWAPADKHETLLKGWKTEQNLTQAEFCIDQEHSMVAGLHACVRMTCPSGLSVKTCEPVQKQDTHTLRHGLVEAQSKSTPDILTMLNDPTESLQQFEIDIIESGTSVVGIESSLIGRTGTWYIMTHSALPSEDCSTDKTCISSMETDGPIGSFPDVKLENNNRYFICVHADPFRSSGGSVLNGVSACGDGFIVDDDSPSSGTVDIFNQRRGFSTDRNILIATWKGFTDYEVYMSDAEVSGIANFSYGVGTNPESNDVRPFTDVGFVHNVHITGLSLQGGQTYYVTVRATDRVGHTISSVSDGVTIDTTPPVLGKIHIGELLESQSTVTSDDLVVHLEGFEDRESGISSFEISVASQDGSDVIPYIETTYSFANLDTRGKLLDGHAYFVKLLVTNRAGLMTITQSKAFMYDKSAPTAGVVRDGGSGGQIEEDYQTDSDNLTCHWTGFHDPHDGAVYFRVGLGTEPKTDDVETMSYMGLRTDITWTSSLPLGVKLYCVVEACNAGDLCSRSESDGITLDNSPPVPGVVTVGPDGHHHKYHGHASTLTVRWFGFEDPQTGINHFEWCVGSTPGNCDILSKTNNLLSDSVIKTGLSLPHGKILYATVWAANPAGLVTSSTSDSFSVDVSPPAVITKPKFLSPYSETDQEISVQWENSVLKLSWKFEDKESPIERHFISLSTHHDSTAAVESIHLGAQDSTTILFEAGNLMRSGDSYTATVTACNAAGVCASASSRQVLVDRSPPELGGFEYPLTWDRVDIKGIRRTRLHLRWYGFSDPESSIDSYSISVSRRFDGEELSEGSKILKHDKTQVDQVIDLNLTDDLLNGENITLTISAMNNAGLSCEAGKLTVSMVSSDQQHSHGTLEIERHSCIVQYCEGQCSCAVVGKMCGVPDEMKNCTESKDHPLKRAIRIEPGLITKTHFSKSASCISAHWQLGDHNLRTQIKRIEWTMGKSGQEEGFPIFDKHLGPIWQTSGRNQQIIYCLPHGKALEHSVKYVIYLRLWLSFSHYTIVESSPVQIDHTPPTVRRARSVLDSDEHCKDDKEFFKTGETITTCWNNVLEDAQSGISNYEFWLGTSPEGNDVIDVMVMGNQTSYTLPLTKLKAGTKYFASVRATNAAGLETTVVSDGFMIDDMKPVAGVVFNTDRHRNIRVQTSTDSFGVSWHGFEDFSSYIERFEAALLEHGQTADGNLFKFKGIDNNLVLRNLTLSDGKSYRVAVRAVDAAGLISDVVYSPPLKIDTSPPQAITCTEYLPPIALKYETDREGGTAELKTNYTMVKGSLYEVEVFGDKSMSDSHVTFDIGQLSVYGRFEYKRGEFVASHRFISAEDGTVDITLAIQDKESHIARIDVHTCKTTVRASKESAVHVRQIRPSIVAVCTNIVDPESGIRGIWMGAGTSQGGYQIRALSPTAVSNHEMILVKEPHGSPVYVTVIAENQAGLRSIFTSAPLIIDHTAPEVTITRADILYGSPLPSTVFVDISWRTRDVESDVDRCFCGSATSHHEVNNWQEAVHDHCILYNISAPHNSLVYASVKCINNVNLETTITSEPLLVLHHGPEFHRKSMSFLVDNRISTGAPQSHMQTYTDHIDLIWEECVSPATYECRLLDGSVIVKNWTSTGHRNYLRLDGLSLLDGHLYEAQVRAVDTEHQLSQPITASILVESRAPTTTGNKPEIHLVDSTLTVDWSKLFDFVSNDITYVVSMGTRKGYTDLINQRTTTNTTTTIHTRHEMTGVYLTVLAKLKTGKFGHFSEFTGITRG